MPAARQPKMIDGQLMPAARRQRGQLMPAARRQRGQVMPAAPPPAAR